MMLLVFFLIPELPAVQLASHVFRSSIQCLRQRPGPLCYWMGTCLGTYCQISTSSDTAAPLHKIDPAHASYKRKAYGLIWLGRFALLILLLVQYSSNFGIWYRALTLFAYRWNSYILFDLRNFQMAVGGIAAVINSVLLALLNVTWHYAPGTTDVEFAQLSSTAQQLTNTHQLRYPPATEPEPTFPSINFIQHKFQTYNNLHTIRLNHFFPVALQRSVEGAMILHTINRLITQLALILNPEYLDLSNLLMEKNPSIFNTIPIPLLDQPGIRWAFYPDIGLDLRWHGEHIFVLPYVSVIMIVISKGIRIIAQNAFLAKHMPQRMVAWFKLCDKWITGGRSLVSFPCFFVTTVIFTVWVDLGGLYRNALGQVVQSSALAQSTQWGRLIVGAFRYKDPWYDSMYIL